MHGGQLEVIMTSDVRTAFSGVDLVVMLAKLDRKANDNHHEYLKNIVRISRQHGAAIEKYAKKTVKVVTTPLPFSVLCRQIYGYMFLRSVRSSNSLAMLLCEPIYLSMYLVNSYYWDLSVV